MGVLCSPQASAAERSPQPGPGGGRTAAPGGQAGHGRAGVPVPGGSAPSEGPPSAGRHRRGARSGQGRARWGLLGILRGALAHPCPIPGMALPRGRRGTGTQGELHPCTWVCKAPEQLKPGPEQPVAALTWGRNSLGDSQGCPQTPHHALSAPWGQLCSQAGGDTAPRADHSTHTCSCWPQGSPGDAVSTKGAVSRGVRHQAITSTWLPQTQLLLTPSSSTSLSLLSVLAHSAAELLLVLLTGAASQEVLALGTLRH